MYNNIAFDTGNAFAIHDYATPGTHHKTDIYVVNNTWYRNDLGVQITEQRERFTNLVIRNNIFAANGCAVNYLSLLDSDVQMDHNLFSGGYIAHEGTDAVLADPLFVDPNASPTPDLRLQAGSPAIDQGSATAAPAFDMNGILRPQGGGFDIGAHEYAAAPPLDGGVVDGGVVDGGSGDSDGGGSLDAGSPDGGRPIDAASIDAGGSEKLNGGCSCTVGGARHRDRPAALLWVLFCSLLCACLRSLRSLSRRRRRAPRVSR